MASKTKLEGLCSTQVADGSGWRSRACHNAPSVKRLVPVEMIEKVKVPVREAGIWATRLEKRRVTKQVERQFCAKHDPAAIAAARAAEDQALLAERAREKKAEEAAQALAARLGGRPHYYTNNGRGWTLTGGVVLSATEALALAAELESLRAQVKEK